MLKSNRKIENALTIIAIISFTILGIRYMVANRRDLVFDIISSIIIVGIFYKLYKKLHQDYKS